MMPRSIQSMCLLLILAVGLSGCAPQKARVETPLTSISSFQPVGDAIWALDFDHRFLIRSSDQGKHFAKVTPPELGKERMLSLFALNGKQAWVLDSAGNVYRTLNGGKDWKKAKGSLAVNDNIASVPSLFFLDVLHGWIQTGIQLYRSDDGGDSWNQIQSNLPFGFGLVFTSSENGWHSRTDGLFRTADGGSNWEQAMQADEETLAQQAFFFGKKHGLLLSYQAGGDQKLSATSDGGNTWKPTAAVPVLSATAGEPISLSYSLTDADHFAAYYHDDSRVLGLFVTSDQGANWQAVKLPGQTEQRVPLLLQNKVLLLHLEANGLEIESLRLDKKNADWETYRPMIVE
ncbi:WD40/YVTN/BNR-like repeat-containing protein [Gorillibacterium sp. sgz500922]|uniref:WD40/YVTN/BNR-like repeat-containing protein n=1 Tax=Gorillibacterium sp. sgz500922 TaxID=3446694 RepID=UPI003F66CD3C